MSDHAHDLDVVTSRDSIARCSLKAARGLDDNPYAGTYRGPLYADESGAYSVCDLLGGDRYVFFREGASQLCRVVRRGRP